MSNPLNNIRIAVKLPIAIVFMVISAVAIVSYVEMQKSRDSLKNAAHKELIGIAAARASALKTYMSGIEEDIKTLQDSEQTLLR